MSIDIEGTLNSTSSTEFRLEFFSNSGCDFSGYGEGENILGSTTVSTNGSGEANFSVTFPATVPLGYVVTATATDPNGNTSEFSECIEVETNIFTVNTADDSDDGVCDEIHCSFREAINTANSHPNSYGTDAIVFNIPGLGPHTIRPTSPLPAIIDPVVIDGYTQPGSQPNSNPAGRGFNNTMKIELDGSDAGNSANGLRIDTGGNTVRGLVINRFGSNGIYVRTGGNNLIGGNFIGTDVSGTNALGNGIGVTILEGEDNVIGGTLTEEYNLISGNIWDGITIGGSGAFTTGNVVQGNLIGTDATGAGDLGNGRTGVYVVSIGAESVIGGTSAGAGNVIAFNGSSGIGVTEGSGNSIFSNSIFSNNDLGIDLGTFGVTPNDPGDGDSGPNNLQNFPVFTSAVSSGAGTTLEGILTSTPNTEFTLEFFSSMECDPSGYGEGESSLGSLIVVTNGSGSVDFLFTPPTPVPSGRYLTATATDPYGNTSEFSQCIGIDVCCGCADCNEDGAVDIIDALWEVNCILGMMPPPCSCDCNQDGANDIVDVLHIVNFFLYNLCP